MRMLPVPNVSLEPGSLKMMRNSQNEGVPPPTISASQGTTMPVCGRVEAYNERSLHVRVKYHSQGVQNLFYESTPSAAGPLGDTTSQRFTEDSGFYFIIFLVSKASGGWRPVINLKQLNTHSDASHFHMHTISSVLNTIEKVDYAFKIDLQDVYFHVLIHRDSREGWMRISCTNT